MPSTGNGYYIPRFVNQLGVIVIRLSLWKTPCVNPTPTLIEWDLSLNVPWQSYLGITRLISWLLMPWLLSSPGHQQPWYWLCRICTSCLTWKKISNTSVISMRGNDIKFIYMLLFPLNNLARKWLTCHSHVYRNIEASEVFFMLSLYL